MNNVQAHKPNDEKVDEAACLARQPTPGEILRENRELRALSVQQVADELNLTMHFVRALESDAYDKLPGEVFARGYMRSYAGLLDLDADQMLLAYSEHVGKETCLEHSKGRRRKRRDRNRTWIIISGIAFIALAIALWFFSSNEAAPSAASVNNQPSNVSQ